MSELLWTCEAGSAFTSALDGVRLMVARSPMGGGYRFELLHPVAATSARMAVASGYREDLREAIEAAEGAARRYLRAGSPQMAEANPRSAEPIRFARQP